MKVEDFVKIVHSDFYTGVPDSLLKGLCGYLYHIYGAGSRHHVIAANEGNAVGIAAGYYLATGKVPVVYMQNSGEGNAINPIASLLNEKVYAIPCIFIIGWRGEPGVADEPQHAFQGEVTCRLLAMMGIEYMVLSPETSVSEAAAGMERFSGLLADGHSVAFVIRKGALTYENGFKNGFLPYHACRDGLSREAAIGHIVDAAGDGLVVCTTGKASRELYEIREHKRQGHSHDFLTVGAMGHCSSIALGAALHTEKKVWCIDGDGALLMHMGAMAAIGGRKPKNLNHLVIHNGVHETVGGMPIAAGEVSFKNIAQALGYVHCYCATDKDGLERGLYEMKQSDGLGFMEIQCQIGSREDLGRPAATPAECKLAFMGAVRSIERHYNENEIKTGGFACNG